MNGGGANCFVFWGGWRNYCVRILNLFGLYGLLCLLGLLRHRTEILRKKKNKFLPNKIASCRASLGGGCVLKFLISLIFLVWCVF